MRRFLTAALVFCVVAIVFVGAPAAEESGGQRVIPINVRISCSGESTFNGQPLTPNSSVRLSKSGGDTVNFSLVSNSDVDTVTVEPKEGQAWPFTDAPPSFGRGRDRGTGSIRADIGPGSYAYSIVFNCGGTRTVIDPKMDIDG